MINSVDNLVFAAQARAEKYSRFKYSQLDCQAFVEKVLADTCVVKADGSPYNWKGVNHIWRVALTWKGTIEEAKKKFGDIPVGAWVFIWRDDGGEKERGYYDGLGNAKHIGIYVGDPEQVRDSTRSTKTKRDGVGYRKLSDFTHVGLPFMIDYLGTDLTVNKPEKPDKQKALEALEVLKLYILGG